MPGLSCKSPQSFCNHTSSSLSGSVDDSNKGSVNGLQCRDGSVDTTLLKKFWTELSSSARHELLRIDKHSLFEQARKNMYCSRCNGLLLEAFSQIVGYSKGLQGGSLSHNKHGDGCNKENCVKGDRISVSNTQDDVRDPSVHPWGGLMATRDNMLTLLDCFLEGQPLEVIQNVCDCARARERERELLYPDACGGGGRGWISQGGLSFVRGHSLKETCGLHTARLSCDALVDFWSALGEETRRSLLRMKEEDFVDRLMFRFESKRFCRDCRRNVLRELKELKELRRSRKELRCTRWFCNADTAFCYEVSNTSVQANWRECLGGDIESTYQHFEWGIGSTEGNSDILGFEDVGLSEGARVDGLDLANISFFYITLRAWKHDGRCTEVSVKAHGLKGTQCVHRRLFVGDGHVTISKGESIRRFFEEAEEAEEEEDEEGTEKNGSESESDGFRVQRHARSPELAREFLLDAATIIFKEQVEKAFREGTARQNAHTIFVCLVLNLLEERIHVACKEISTLEKQKQLLEEEEQEKQEEEKRKERRRIKEKEKKLRKKEKQKGRDRMKKDCKEKSSTVENDCEGRQNEEVCSDDEIKSSAKMVDEDTCISPLVMQEVLSEGTVEEAGFPSGSDGALNFLDLVNNKEFQNSNDAFILEHLKAAKKRSKMRKGPLMEIVPPRRFTRRGAFDLSCNSRVSLNSTCSSTSHITEDIVVGTLKHSNTKVMKPERSGVLGSIETWNNIRYQHRQTGYAFHNPSKRPLQVKSKPNGTSLLNTKSLERKNMVSVSSKQPSRLNNFVTGSVMCNWQIVRTNASDTTVKKGLSDKEHCEVLSNPSLQENENLETPEAECSRSLTMVSNNSQELCMSTNHRNSHGLLSRSCTDCLENSCEVNLFEEVESSSANPNTSCSMLTNLTPISTSGSLDEDTSPSSTASFFTDTSDGEVTSNSVTTESSSYLESTATSVEVSEISTPVANTEKLCTQSIYCNSTNVGHEKYNVPLFEVDDYHKINSFPCPEFYPYSNDPKLLQQHYSGGFEHIPLAVSVEVQAPIIDIASHGYELDPTMMQHGYEVDPTMMQHGYELDPTMQLPLAASPSLLPINPPPPHPFGYSWVQGQCVAAPVLNTYPPHPGSLYIDVGTPIGLTTTLLPFQPGPPELSFACMPGVPEDSNFACWGSEPYILEEQPNGDLFSSIDVFQQHVLPPEEGFQEFSSPNVDDVIPASTELPNDTSGFSLFHFGSLSGEEQEKASGNEEGSSRGVVKRLEVSCSSTSMQQQSTKSGVLKPSLHVEEYSLFAARPSHRFSFF